MESLLWENGVQYMFRQTREDACNQRTWILLSISFSQVQRILLVKNPKARKFDFETNWQPYMPFETSYKECFLKIRVNVSMSFYIWIIPIREYYDYSFENFTIIQILKCHKTSLLAIPNSSNVWIINHYSWLVNSKIINSSDIPNFK